MTAVRRDIAQLQRFLPTFELARMLRYLLGLDATRRAWRAIHYEPMVSARSDQTFKEFPMNNEVKNDLGRDMNRDPITDAPGSHPVGTGLGSASGAAAGAAIGAIFGPIGLLVGGTAGAIIGGAAGHSAAEQIDPTGETDYWRNTYSTRPYVDKKRSFDTDYQPAYLYGVQTRNQFSNRNWDQGLESELSRDWDKKRASSTLSWNDAAPAVKDAWDRTDRTYNAYGASDRYYQSRFANADYRDSSYDFDDYRSAYRYGTYARSAYPGRTWDDKLESDLGLGWDRAKGTSKLGWEKAKSATRDAWHSIERALPGDADHDGR